jgi:hypothetical protein
MAIAHCRRLTHCRESHRAAEALALICLSGKLPRKRRCDNETRLPYCLCFFDSVHVNVEQSIFFAIFRNLSRISCFSETVAIEG